jgi:archaellum component FlaG (FlaF/FlaG flagellin family)
MKPFGICVITDNGSVEVFVDGGRQAITDLVTPNGSPWSASQF